MKTSIDIPDQVLEESIRFTGAKSKREAVVAAMESFNRRAKAEAFLKRVAEGPPLDFPSNEELEAAEVTRGNRAFHYFQPPPEKSES
jgi:Arc/MetJ family transcription regulator